MPVQGGIVDWTEVGRTELPALGAHEQPNPDADPTEHVDAVLSYQYLKKESERASESYIINRVTISLGYRF